MNDRRTRALLTLNLFLLIVLALVTMVPSGVRAQSDNKRANGQYGIVGGRIQGRTEAAIYVVDASNEELIALHWDSGRRRFNPVGYRDLLRDQQLRSGRVR